MSRDWPRFDICVTHPWLRAGATLMIQRLPLAARWRPLADLSQKTSEGLIDPMGFLWIFGGKTHRRKPRWNKWCAFRITIWWLWCDDSWWLKPWLLSHESLGVVPICAYHWIMRHGSRSAEMSKCAFKRSLLIDVQECGLTAKKKNVDSWLHCSSLELP